MLFFIYTNMQPHIHVILYTVHVQGMVHLLNCKWKLPITIHLYVTLSGLNGGNLTGYLSVSANRHVTHSAPSVTFASTKRYALRQRSKDRDEAVRPSDQARLKKGTQLRKKLSSRLSLCKEGTILYQ